MESHQLEMLRNSCVVSESLKPKLNSIIQNSGDLSEESRVPENKTVVGRKERSIGVLEVCIHQARDIHNICIYHKQDVYAKICLTSDPETAVSTQTVNGGGKNPVFNESLQLDVQTIDSSLKCEIWMLSRVRNYLEDQLLGFALVPLSDVVIGKGKLEQEFSLSSSDLFHSPAGFVKLSLTYTGTSPEVLEIPAPRSSAALNLARHDSEVCEFEKIEFPDPNIVNETEMMVSEFYGVPCAELESKSTECLGTTDNGKHLSSEDNGKHLSSEDTSAQLVEGISIGSLDDVEVPKVETPPSSVPTVVSSLMSNPGTSQLTSDIPGASEPLNQNGGSYVNGKKKGAGEATSGCSTLPESTFAQPVISVNIEPEQKVVQQDIVDMYMKSMQQFTESLAKMKLPLDIDNGKADLGNAGSDEKLLASKSTGQSPRVFYGSRAFF